MEEQDRSITYLHLFPLLVFILVPGTFIITYAIAVGLKHVEAGFPYISDTGTYSPESCIFGQLLNISAVLVSITIYLRYCQVQEFLDLGPTWLRKVNIGSLFLGFIAALGVSIVGNFQEKNVLVVHAIGAFMAFGLGVLYAWIQTIVSFRMCPHMNPTSMCGLRLFISGFSTICFIIMFIVTPISVSEFHGKDKTKWQPDDGGFVPHVISTSAEWLMAISFMFYFLTFVKEFQDLAMIPPKVYIQSKCKLWTNLHTDSPEAPNERTPLFA